ncbi:hypothetical protein [Microbacterium arborescens]|uniref:hypothetical protein n=1 Tax=Microbacterium arborescens TaxID=33883 RepID=UPI00277EB43C|nr:hypothetical protein [Microbacterium arborescens]MDQ1215725.1 hypothetical protein [Microbacterium arborescens]
MNTKAANAAVPVALDELHFDRKNPRLSDADFANDEEALEALVEDADINELVQAIGNSGWLDYEPLVVWREGNYVLEGNRRLAALRILSDPDLQEEFGITPPEPLHENALPREVLAITVRSRSEARDYIGFKHVNGPHKWDSLAKAKFAWSWITEDENTTLAEVAKRLGDGHNTVARLVNAYIVLMQATKLGFDITKRTKTNFSFSHLYTGLPRPSAREFLGLSDAPNELLPPDPVPAEKHSNLLEFMTLLYGQGERKTVIGSQNPDLNRVLDVLANPTATSMLVNDGDLKLAYSQVVDKGRRFAELIFALNKSARAVNEATGDYSYDPDLHDMMLGVQKTVRSIISSMNSEKDAAETGESIR